MKERKKKKKLCLSVKYLDMALIRTVAAKQENLSSGTKPYLKNMIATPLSESLLGARFFETDCS